MKVRSEGCLQKNLIFLIYSAKINEHSAVRSFYLFRYATPVEHLVIIRQV